MEIRNSRFAMCVELINSVSYSYGMEFVYCGGNEFSLICKLFILEVELGRSVTLFITVWISLVAPSV